MDFDYEFEKRMNRILGICMGAEQEARECKKLMVLLIDEFRALAAIDVAKADAAKLEVRQVLTTEEAARFVGYDTVAQFKNWCARWKVMQTSRGRYARKYLDLALDREGGIAFTPAALRRVSRNKSNRAHAPGA